MGENFEREVNFLAMLPEFPRTAGDLMKYAIMRITKRRIEIDPITDVGIQTVAHEGRSFSYEQEGTGIVEDTYHEFALPIELRFTEVPELVGPAFEAKLDYLAELQGKLMTPFVYSRIDAAIERGGTAVHAANKPLSKELFLEMLDRMEMTFDALGRPEFEWHAAPATAEYLAAQWKEWVKDAEFMAKHDALLDRKREAFLDRESNRKLVD